MLGSTYRSLHQLRTDAKDKLVGWFKKRGTPKVDSPEQNAWTQRRSQMWSSSHWLTGHIIDHWETWDSPKRAEIISMHEKDQAQFEATPPEPVSEGMRLAWLANCAETAFRERVLLDFVSGVYDKVELKQMWNAMPFHDRYEHDRLRQQ